MNQESIVHEKMLNASKWALGAEIFAKLVTPISSILLARFLEPDAFGIIATISIIISLADLLSDAGFSKYLVQHRFSDETELSEYANTAFMANLFISVSLLIIIFFRASFFATMVGAKGYELGITVSALKLLITSLTSIQRAVFQRNLDYKTMFLARMIVSLIPLTLTIPLAKAGFGYWSLIIATLANEVSYAIILTIKSEWKPQFVFSLCILKKMLPFSAGSLFEQFTIWLTTYADTFILSHYLTSYYVGLYKQPYQLISNIFSIFTASIFAILFSALSRFNDIGDDEGYLNTLFRAEKVLSLVVAPMGVGIFIYKDFVTSILLGSKWKEAAIVIGCFGLEKIVQLVINNSASEVYRSKGKPFLSSLAQVVFLVSLIPVCIMTLRMSFDTFVIARASMCVVFAFIHSIIIRLNFSINIWRIIPQIIHIIISTIAMGVIGWILKRLLPPSMIIQTVQIIVCIGIYLISVMSFNDTREILKKITKRAIKESVTK